MSALVAGGLLAAVRLLSPASAAQPVPATLVGLTEVGAFFSIAGAPSLTLRADGPAGTLAIRGGAKFTIDDPEKPGGETADDPAAARAPRLHLLNTGPAMSRE